MLTLSRAFLWLARTVSVVIVLMLLEPGLSVGAEDSSAPDLASRELNCDAAIASREEVLDGYSTVFDRVALRTETALQANPVNPDEPRFKLFAKSGLYVGKKPFELVIPRSWRSRAAIGWGTTQTTRLRVPACARACVDCMWLVFAGGYYVPQPACIPVIVKTGADRVRVKIGVGARCPGQDPPAPPVA